VVVAAVTTGLIPYFKLRKLLKNSLHPQGLRDEVTVQVASLALLVGVPLLAVTYFARENVSGHNEIRNGLFVESDISTTLGWKKNRPRWQKLIEYDTIMKDVNACQANATGAYVGCREAPEKESKSSDSQCNLKEALSELEQVDLKTDELEKKKSWWPRDQYKLYQTARCYRKRVLGILNKNLICNQDLTLQLLRLHVPRKKGDAYTIFGADLSRRCLQYQRGGSTKTESGITKTPSRGQTGS
jgi:hypothetical protein